MTESPAAEDAHAADAVPTPRRTAFETALIAGGLVLFLVFLYEMATPDDGSFLSPPLVAAAGVILLWPLRAYHTVKALLFSGGFLLLLWFVTQLSAILAPFLVVYLLSFLFNPLVTLLRDRFHVPRWVSSLLVTLFTIGVVALFALLLVPNIVGELKALTTRLVTSVTDLRQWIATTPLLDRLEETGLINKDDVLQRLTTLVRDQADQVARGLPDTVESVVRSIGSLLELVTVVTIMPVLLFYMLKDYPFIHRQLVQLFPTFGGRRDYLMHAGTIVGNYLRGQLTISAISAFNVSIALLILDVPFALLIGLTSGLLNMIPNFGAILTNIVGVTLALIFGDPWYWDVVKVVAVLIGQGLLEQSVLTPNILGHQVGIHPVLILFSLFSFGYFLGIFGLLIAVPTTALLVTFYKAYRSELTLDLADYQQVSDAPRALRRSSAADSPETPPSPATPTDDPPPDEPGDDPRV